MTTLELRFKKGADGRMAAFALHRADGTFTVQRHPHDFFPAHDFTHYAVETILGLRQAFYGLVSDGWDFADFGTPWPRGPMPGGDAETAERIVGLLDLERTSGHQSTAEALTEYLRSRQSNVVVTDRQLDQIRQARDGLIARWHAVPLGETLTLIFDAERLAVGS